MNAEGVIIPSIFSFLRFRGSSTAYARARARLFPAKWAMQVVRNRVKRLLREFFRLHCDALPVETDIVTVAKRHAGTAALDLSRVAAELLPLLRRLARPEPKRPCSGGM